MNELKPCPFCGGKAEIRKESSATVNTDTNVDTIRFLVGVSCTSCNSKGKLCQSVITVYRWGEMNTDKDGFKEAITAWNAREEHE